MEHETYQVKLGYRVVLLDPTEKQLVMFDLGGNSFDDHDTLLYLGEDIIDALPEEAFEPYIEG